MHLRKQQQLPRQSKVREQLVWNLARPEKSRRAFLCARKNADRSVCHLMTTVLKFLADGKTLLLAV
jgi:hypothetical protein